MRRRGAGRLCTAVTMAIATCFAGTAVAQTIMAMNADAAMLNSATLPDAPSTSAMRHTFIVASATPADTQSSWLVAPSEAPYRPLTPHEKFQSFVHHTFSPYTMAGAVYDATWAQAWGDPYAYGGGTQGWSKRFGASVAGTEARSFFGSFFFPTLLHQDPRYFAMYKGPVVKRGLHAIERVFVTRDDSGREVFNSSGILTTAFTESLGMAWTPDGQRSASRLGTRMLGAMQGEATSYVLREFTPDFIRLFKRHAPASLKRLQARLPWFVSAGGQ